MTSRGEMWSNVDINRSRCAVVEKWEVKVERCLLGSERGLDPRSGFGDPKYIW